MVTTAATATPKVVTCPHCKKQYTEAGILRHVTQGHWDLMKAAGSKGIAIR
jgi:hypothetical protein